MMRLKDVQAGSRIFVPGYGECHKLRRKVLVSNSKARFVADAVSITERIPVSLGEETEVSFEPIITTNQAAVCRENSGAFRKKYVWGTPYLELKPGFEFVENAAPTQVSSYVFGVSMLV